MKDDRFCNSNCPFTRAIGTIGNKWKPIIINVIGTRTIRFGQLDSIVPHISRKVLTEQLKELEEDGPNIGERLIRNYNQHNFELGLIKRFFDFCDEQGLIRNRVRSSNLIIYR